MSKKIGDFLFCMLIICTILVLMASGGRSAPKSDPAPSTPTQQTTQPDTDPLLPPSGSDPTQPMELGQASLNRVKAILDKRKPEQTARSQWIWTPDLNALEAVRGTAAGSVGWALAQLAAEREMNPISAFWLLVTEELYEKEKDDAAAMTANPFSIGQQEARTYAYTDEGAEQLIRDLLTLAAGMEDGLALEQALLDSDEVLLRVSLSKEEGCRYSYLIAGGERSTHILCFYLRPDKGGQQIADVEFQLLNLRSAQGSADQLAMLDRRGDTQAAALMAAAELLLTGQTQAHTGAFSHTRQVGGLTATVERFHFTAEGEAGTLTNYRLRK